MDEGHKRTDELLADLERKVHSAYNAAHGDLEKVIANYFADFQERDKKMLELLNTGEITEEKYKQWRLAQIGRGERYKELQKKIADRMLNANQTAVAYMNDATPGIYSLNYNYSAYTIEQANEGVDFTLYDEQTVRRLVADDPELWPRPRIDIPADQLWNKQNVRNAITSGILLGESIGKIASRLERVTDMNRNAAIRNARTAVTGAQNAGRQASYDRAAEMGIKVVKEWIATLDFRTRHSHAALDGKRVAYNEKFHSILGSEMMYPGDREGKPADVYNCRCTTAYVDALSTRKRETYTEWYAKKEQENKTGVHLETKKIRNEASDRKQYAQYYEIIKTKAGKTFADFQTMKYNDPEKWEYTKGLKRYIEKYPDSNKAYYDAHKKLKDLGMKKGVLLPPNKKIAYILPSGSYDPYHIMKRMQSRGITDDDIRGFMSDSIAMFSQWGGNRQLFVGRDGFCVVQNINGDWIYKTAWSKKDFDEESETILEVLKDAGL